MEQKIHEGQNIKCFREMLGLKQGALAYELGERWTQKKVSVMEAKESIDPVILQQVSEVLKIPAEVIQTINGEQAINEAINIISNSKSDLSNEVEYNASPKINTAERWLETMLENKQLYERMLTEKDDRIKWLEDMLSRNVPFM